MSNNQSAILSALKNVKRFAAVAETDFEATRLGGLTNLVFRVELTKEFGSEKLIVRIPGEGTSEFIDRHVELHNARVAEKAGIGAPIIWADPDTGLMISRYIEDAVTLSPALFKSDAGAVTRVGKCLAQLHGFKVAFQFHFDPLAVINSYIGILAEKEVELPQGFSLALAQMPDIERRLKAAKVQPVPCHCDPLSENFLDDGNRVWLVDWEYSGMNDPMWDLGDLSVEAEFDPEQDKTLLQAYFNREPDSAELERMVIFKALCDLLWALWGLIQHENGADVEDFHAYALARFQRCQTLMQSPDFPT